MQILTNFIRLHIQSESSIYYVAVFQKCKIFFFNLFYCLFLRQYGDIEVNPRPKKKAAAEHFSCYHLNVNSLAAHDYKKVSLLDAYVIHHYDLICVSETYLDSSISNGEKDISVKGYGLVRAYHPSNPKRGGVCIYYKESVGVRVIDIPNLTEFILCQVTISNNPVDTGRKLNVYKTFRRRPGRPFNLSPVSTGKTGCVLVFYRSPSQSSDEFFVKLQSSNKSH